MTITEALQEIKTIGKRLEKKRSAITQYACRDSRIKDPLEKDGGSVTYIKKERQAIADLEKRIVDIRTAIQRKNLATTLTLHERTMSIAEWLTWRREVSSEQQRFINTLGAGIRKLRDDVQKKGGRLITSEREADAIPGEVVVHIDEKKLLEEAEEIESLLGDLDGKLSLLNATTTIEV